MNKFNAFLIGGVILIALGFVFLRPQASDQLAQTPSSVNQVDQEVDLSGDEMMDLGHYVDYSETNLTQAQKRGTTVLFFAATAWCQTCEALDQELLDRYEDIPDDITVLKVDYDNDRAMKSTWNVTVQHTLIVLDQQGVEQSRWIGGGLDNLLSRIEEI